MIIAATALVIGLLLVILSQIPSVRSKVQCKSNMTAISLALQRYYWPNEGFPDSLETLRKDYLKDPKVLRCPLDKSPGDKSSYTYIKPAANASNDVIVLRCDRHNGSHGNRIILEVTKGGEFKVELVATPVPVGTTQKWRGLQSGNTAKPLPPNPLPR